MVAERRKDYDNRRDNDHAGDVDDDDQQDIVELWFAGQHGDIGGGWPLGSDEERPLSDIALMWMIKEAHKAGMPFDEYKLRASNLWFEGPEPEPVEMPKEMPLLRVDGKPVPESPKAEPQLKSSSAFEDEYHRIATKSRVHDSLELGGGLSWTAVMAWSIMEWLPFRRMDLQPDGSWSAISWPLPRGETRDMSHDCKVHHSVIKRMEADPTYRPGNLIVGGGGRGTRVAPQKYGMGTWRVVHEPDDLIGEAYVKDMFSTKD